MESACGVEVVVLVVMWSLLLVLRELLSIFLLYWGCGVVESFIGVSLAFVYFSVILDLWCWWCCGV